MRFALSGLVRMVACLTLATAFSTAVAAQAQEPVDLDAIFRIKDEGLNRSEVMEVASYLTDVYGPRLTGSPNIRNAGEYVRQKLTEWELVDVNLEEWGPFGRGWTNDYLSLHMSIGAQTYPMIGYPKAWTPGTGGRLSGDAVIAIIDDSDDMERFRGELRGKYVLTARMPTVEAQFEAPGVRFSDEQLVQRARQPVPTGRGRRGGRGGGGGGRGGGPSFAEQRMQFFVDEGVAGLLEPGRGTGGTVFVQHGGTNPWDVDAEPMPPQVALAVEHYGRIYRTLEKDLPVSVEMDIRNTFHDEDLDAFNIVGEIPGSGRADEVVMLGAHFDSWHSGTGATDNAAGSAVMMEAVRILKAAGLSLDRTVRIALWTGEEHGYFGSRAYVADHFANRETMELQPEHEKLSGYFNVDNGTGTIRGVYLQGNEMAAPVFSAWMAPFANIGMSTLSIRNTGGTDHIPFDEVGLPGFQFIQDPIEYNSRTHHSSMDVYERLQEADMKQNAVIVAAFVYHAANRDELLPRKPLPRPARTDD